MTQKGFVNIVLIAIVVALIGGGTYFALNWKLPKSSTPVIERISPVEAPMGATITIIGSGFTPTENSLQFGNGFAYINDLVSSDGKTMLFTLPEFFDTCSSDGSLCAEFLNRPVPGQMYEIVVTNANGKSNAINFTVAHEDGQPIPTPTPKICTQDAKQCPDGSYVSREGPNCEFAKCPTINPPFVIECKKDSDCPSSNYSCEAIEGVGIVCPSDDPSCVPTSTIVKGACKLKEGNRCNADSNCVAGLLCHARVCTSPIGRQCNGPSDSSCPTDFECTQGCGPPVSQENDPPPPYFCQLKGYDQPCPICLAKNTLIDTPSGSISVTDLQIGMSVWTMNKYGQRVSGVITKTSKVQVPPTHQMVHLILDDGREVFVSPRHPTIDGRTVGELAPRDLYDGVSVVGTKRVSYDENATYDILPSGDTGFYWANGILMDSTLR